mgnify:CR=1 FL=1
MKHFNETIIVKPGFVKTKAWGLCGTIALFTGLALVMGTTTSSADEVQPTASEPVTTVVSPTTAQPTVETSTTQPTAVNTSTASSEATSEAVTTATSEAATATTSEPVSADTSTASSEATSEAVTATSEAATTAATEKTEDTTPSYPEVKPEPKITKDGTAISVENPDVHMEFPKGHGIYAVSIVKYHVDFPDDITIDDKDTVTVTLPKELTFPTQYTFDVTNPEGVVIGQAVADSAKNTIVTTFNDYFKKNPLNKSMNLELSVRWTSYIEPDKEYTISIDGTAIKYHSAKEIADVDPTRALSKWGSQDKKDPTLINWVLQLNYGYLWSKQVLTDYQLLDTLGPNQKLVEDSFSAEIVDSVVPFKTSGDAMHYLQDLKTSPESFSFRIARLDRCIYLHYQTRLTQAEEDSYNPTNHVDLTYKTPTDDGKTQDYDARVALVNGKGDARGENITTPAQVTFKLSKELTGRTLQNGEFTFQLKAADGTVLDTKTNDADGNITFNTITYRQAGTYKYTVEEVKGTDEDIHYDDMKATILVAVDKEGRAYVAHTTMPEDTIFNNSVKQTTPAETVLTFDKVLAKGTLKDQEFQFQLRDDKGNVIDTATNDATGQITFKPLVHTQAGVYHYTVKEVNTNNEDIIYDNKVADVTIKVAKTVGETLNSMVSTVTYPQDKTFTNTVKDLQPATTSLHFTKRFEGGQLKGGEFTFELRDDKGTVLQTVTNDKDGNITFNPITYTTAGNHIYHVSEVKGTDPDVIYDSKVADVNVMVVKTIGDTLNTLVSTTKYPQETAFINKMKDVKSATAEIVFNKVLHGRELKAGEFTFNLRDEKGQIIATATNDDKGKIEFKDLTFDKPGAYHYVVTEAKGSDVDVIYDNMVADVTINVTKEIGDELNSLVSSVVYPQDTTFDNTIKELKPVTASLSFDKLLKGRDLKENEFTFALFEVTDKGEQFKGFAQNDKNGHITFGNLTFGTEGQHHFAVKEVVGKDEDVIYDSTVAKADITVTKTIHDTFNALVSNVEYGTKTFTNTIKELKGTEVSLTFHKELHGRELKDGEFMFALFEETDKGNIFYGFATNDAKGNIVFDHLDFDKPGVHNFFVQEVIGKDSSVTYDDLLARATVTIEKVIGKTENSLKATVKYSDDITFDNSVKPEKPKDEKPKGDKPKGDKPKGETPKGETPKQEQYQKGNTLPNTGDEKGSALGLFGIGLSLMAVGLFGKKRKHN